MVMNMPIAEFILLAFLGSTGAGIPGNAPPRTDGVDTVVQPNGGATAAVNLEHR